MTGILSDPGRTGALPGQKEERRLLALRIDPVFPVAKKRSSPRLSHWAAHGRDFPTSGLNPQKKKFLKSRVTLPKIGILRDPDAKR